MQEAPIHQSHVFGRIKISLKHFEKGHARNIPLKLFQNLTSGFGEEDFSEFLPVLMVQEAHIHHSNVDGWIRISQIPFENGHTRNISVKLFQNQTNGS